MPLGMMLVCALGACVWALWIRRTAWGCRWEGAPTLAIAMAGASAYLTSPHASSHLDPRLHRLTGLWNLEDVVGHVCGMTPACAMLYMCLIRFDDDNTVQQRFAKWVGLPVTIAIPVMFACFMAGVGSKYDINFEDIEPGPWHAVYWLVFCAVIIYLMARTLQILLLLRRVDGRSIVVSMYITTASLTIVCVTVMFLHVVTPFNLRAEAWAIAYVATACWAVTPALSWRRRSRPLVIVSPEELLAEG